MPVADEQTLVAEIVTVVSTTDVTVSVCHTVDVSAAGHGDVVGAPQPLACNVMGKHLTCPKSGLT